MQQTILELANKTTNVDEAQMLIQLCESESKTLSAQLKILLGRKWPKRNQLGVKTESQEVDWAAIDEILSLNQEPRAL